MSWSEEQLAAIELRDRNLLVAAAAGSGKTSVLVERIIRRVTDPHQPVDIDSVLVVTFTNAAAAEMKSRIGMALSAALAAADKDPYLERQLALLNSAPISTLHAFCQHLIRQYFYILDIDPNFRIAGEAEIELIRADVLEKLFENLYAQGDEAFLGLAERYGGEDGDTALYNLVLELYDFSRSQPWPDYWLDGLTERFEVPEGCDIDDTPWSPLIRQKVMLEAEEGQRRLDALIRQALRPGAPAPYAATFRADKMVLEELMQAAATSWQALAGVMETIKFETIAKTGNEVAPEVKEALQKERNQLKDKIRKLRDTYFCQTAQGWLEDLRKTAPVVRSLAELVKKFGRHFSQAKLDKGLLDFNDLEHYALKILLSDTAVPGVLQPSPIALKLQEKYTEVMVDEYQDINNVQEAILQLVASAARPNRFMVGDVKQSIYRFRLAEPSLFMDKYRAYRSGETGREYRVDLSRNFRSRPEILDAVNYLFTQLMTARASELEYGEAEKLHPGPDYPPADGMLAAGPVELYILDQDDVTASEAEQNQEAAAAEDCAAERAEIIAHPKLTGFEQEAALIAERIRSLVDSGSLVFDKNEKRYRPVMWRDVVVLLRSVQGKAHILAEAMRQQDIPCYAELDGGYFQETEVQVILSLLGVIDNALQDILLAGVLRSPLGNFSAAELAEIRLSLPGSSLWDALTAYPPKGDELSAKVSAFIAQLKAWRRLARRAPVADLIWTIYRDTGYYDYVGGMPGGALRQANLRAMYDRARQFEATNYRGLFRFLRFIERLRDKGSDMSVARTLGENENVLRIMSIHKSKGLEFPVVVIADLGKGINLQDSKAPVVCHKSLGVGPYLIDPELRYRYPTLARLAVQHKINMETKAEELRILYVALTRAREKLILTGSAPKLAQKCAAWCRETGRREAVLPDSLITAANSYLDWIGPAVARHASGWPLRDYCSCDEEPHPVVAAWPGTWDVRIGRREEVGGLRSSRAEDDPFLRCIEAAAPVPTGRDVAWVDAVLGWQYPFQDVAGIPAKLTVTEIKRRLDVLAAEDGERWYGRGSLANRPAFLQDVGRLTAAEKGTVMHTVMQHLDFSGPLDTPGIVAQVRKMAERELLLPSQAEAVDYEAIAAFFETPLGRRLRQASWVRREMPFSLMLPAARFYPGALDPAEQVFVQGVVDCLFKEQDGLVLVDYKTDRGAAPDELAARYCVQLTVYAEAIERILRLPVREKCLYAFENRQIIRI
ncbi:MAG: helicase-exonuclease AddAB subunit AddA [Negativicutes bacterium]|nr:helicase-exonuclease AddAB subunit AddA [Negativicutes bacterium]